MLWCTEWVNAYYVLQFNMGIYQGNELTHNLSQNACPQCSQLAPEYRINWVWIGHLKMKSLTWKFWWLLLPVRQRRGGTQDLSSCCVVIGIFKFWSQAVNNDTYSTLCMLCHRFVWKWGERERERHWLVARYPMRPIQQDQLDTEYHWSPWEIAVESNWRCILIDTSRCNIVAGD